MSVFKCPPREDICSVGLGPTQMTSFYLGHHSERLPRQDHIILRSWGIPLHGVNLGVTIHSTVVLSRLHILWVLSYFRALSYTSQWWVHSQPLCLRVFGIAPPRAGLPWSAPSNQLCCPKPLWLCLVKLIYSKLFRSVVNMHTLPATGPITIQNLFLSRPHPPKIVPSLSFQGQPPFWYPPP